MQNKGRFIGVLILVQVAVGIFNNFFFTSPLFKEPGFIINAAGYAAETGMAALIGMVLGLITLLIALISYPLIKEVEAFLARLFLALAGVVVATSVMESISLMNLVNYSLAYQSAASSVQDQMMAMKVIVTSIRNWSHYAALMVSSVTLYSFYLSMTRTGLMPRLLAVFGMFATVMQAFAIAMPFIGQPLPMIMLAPIALAQIATGFFLTVKGFKK